MHPIPTVLVVDDHRPTAKTTADVLKKIYPKWTVLTAHSVKESLSYIEDHSIDAVVTDWKLKEHNSKENGFIVIKAALRKDPLCITILITAFPGEFDRYKDAFSIGVYDCINKRQQGIRVSREIAIKLEAALEKRWAHKSAGFYARHIDEHLRDKLGATSKHTKLNDRFVTVMFTDIRGFSKISEQLVSHKDVVAEFLQNLYAITVLCAHAHGGIVDKFMGDGAMLLFGAFDSDPSRNNSDHARRACRAALQLQANTTPLIESFRNDASRCNAALKPQLSLGIGINTAQVLVGIIQTKNRDQYTALGHGVNLAQRFEGAAGKDSDAGKGKKGAVYGGILVSESVELRVRDHFELKPEPILKIVRNISEEHKVWNVIREKPRNKAM